MKTIEEKAKAYDEALERARKEYKNHEAFKGFCGKLVHIFPELVENNDEKIRKEMIEVIRKEAKEFPSSIIAENASSWIAWLEKQGKLVEEYEDRLDRCACESFNKGYKAAIEHQKEKPTDKIEPKFKVGDWIVNNEYNNIVKVLEVKNEQYKLDYCGTIGTIYVPIIDNDYHLWTIKDAKDGDVLVYGDNPEDNNIEIIMLFKSLRNIHWAFTHFHMYNDGDYRVNDWCDCGENAHPATKEQRDLLFQKMKEAGYEWDVEKKELKKIENKNPLLSDFFKAEYERGKADALKCVEWSEEDEDMIQALNACIDAAIKSGMTYISFDSKSILIGKVKNWLKSFKGKVQPKQEWSEEDDNKINSIKYLLHELDNHNFDNWLKSLKDRIHVQNLTVTDEELDQAKKDAYNDALDKIEYHSGEPTFDDGWSAAIWYLKKRNIQPQPKQEWSEEDEEKFRDVIRLVEQGAPVQSIRDHYTNWLKSLKQKYAYDPSDEQLEALKKAIDGVIGDVLNWHSKDRNLLESLYNNLKKLKV